MKLNVQKRLAGDVMKCSAKRVVLDTERLADIKEAITKIDIKGLIKDKAITKKPVKSVSRVRARAQHKQKRSGKRKGQGSRNGKANARESEKTTLIRKIRSQRELLKKMKENKIITNLVYNTLYGKAKGGFCRSKKHLKIYIEGGKLINK